MTHLEEQTKIVFHWSIRTTTHVSSDSFVIFCLFEIMVKRRSFSTKHNRVEIEKKSNPFDLHVNRLKHDVLGKRRSYEKGGQPLKSRSRGIEKVMDLFIIRSLGKHFICRENEHC